MDIFAFGINNGIPFCFIYLYSVAFFNKIIPRPKATVGSTERSECTESLSKAKDKGSF
jgi:hypothetical protein